jgi:hypothetical protein
MVDFCFDEKVFPKFIEICFDEKSLVSPGETRLSGNPVRRSSLGG